MDRITRGVSGKKAGGRVQTFEKTNTMLISRCSELENLGQMPVGPLWEGQALPGAGLYPNTAIS